MYDQARHSSQSIHTGQESIGFRLANALILSARFGPFALQQYIQLTHGRGRPWSERCVCHARIPRDPDRGRVSIESRSLSGVSGVTHKITQNKLSHTSLTSLGN